MFNDESDPTVPESVPSTEPEPIPQAAQQPVPEPEQQPEQPVEIAEDKSEGQAA
jgi:hypothetical protein